MNIDRTDLFADEIRLTFLAYNRPIQEKTVQAKSILMSETLKTLSTAKISAFFKYIRENEPQLPTDGQLKRILGATHERFSSNSPKLTQIEYKGSIPTPEWLREYTEYSKAVISGQVTSEEAKQRLGI